MTYKREKIGKDHPLMRALRAAGVTRRHSGSIIHGMDEVRVSGYWDGGSRDRAWHFNLDTLKVSECGLVGDPEQFGGGDTMLKHPDARTAIVECGTFCGKPSWPAIYMPPSEEPRKEWTCD